MDKLYGGHVLIVYFLRKRGRGALTRKSAVSNERGTELNVIWHARVGRGIWFDKLIRALYEYFVVYTCNLELFMVDVLSSVLLR